MGRARITMLLTGLLVALVLPTAALASSGSPFDPLGFRYSSPTYLVHAHDGVATIPIQRTNTPHPAWVRDNAQPGPAVKDQDFTAVKDILSFAPGQSSASFQVPIVDHGLPGPPKTIELGMFGAYPIGTGTPDNAVLTIINDDQPNIVRNALNPLGLQTPPPASDPLTGTNPFIDWEWGLAALAERQLKAAGRGGDAALMHVI